TARATQERTGVAAGLTSSTLRLAGGSTQTLCTVARALEEMGYERVPTVTEVAQFSVRGGIVDVYGFGMAGPARLEWWGDTLEALRGFDLTTQRSTEPGDERTVLPRGGSAVRRPGGKAVAPGARRTLLELLPGETLILEASATANAEEVGRSWREAAHHLEVARRLGEEVPSREVLFEPPEEWSRRLAPFARLEVRSAPDPGGLNAGFFPPEPVDRDIKRLRAMLSTDIPTLILCDNEGQLERLDELLNEDGR